MPSVASEIAARVTQEHALLASFAKVIEQYETKKTRLKVQHGRSEHGGLGTMLESALIDYLGDALPPGLRLGEGTPVLESVPTDGAQTDVVVDFDGEVWSSTRHAPKHLADDAIYLAAMEVRYRGPWLRRNGAKSVARSAMEVVRRLQELTDRALAADRKCWTAAVLLGPGFDVFTAEGAAMRPKAVAALVAELRAFYEPRGLQRRRIPGGVKQTWPYVDVLVLPGLLLKKHTLFAMPKHVEHPVYAIQPTIAPVALRSLRPLSAAKGYLRHGLRALAEGKGFEEPAWSDAEDVIYGGPVTLNLRPHATPEERLAAFRTHSRAVVLDGTGGHLYHAGLGNEGVKWFETGPSTTIRGALEPVSTEPSRLVMPTSVWP